MISTAANDFISTLSANQRNALRALLGNYRNFLSLKHALGIPSYRGAQPHPLCECMAVRAEAQPVAAPVAAVTLTIDGQPIGAGA